MPVFVLLGVFLGVTMSRYFIILSPYAPWLLGFMILAGALKLEVRELGKTLITPKPLILYFFTAHILIPLIVFFISSYVFKFEPETISGFILLYAVPTAISSFVWITVFRGNAALSLTLILLGSILAPLIVPGTVRLFLGTGINIDTTGMIILLIYMVVIPTIIGVSVNEFSRGKIPAILSPWFSPLSKICLFIVIAANTAPVAPQIRFDNPRLWLVLAGCLTFNILGFACGKLTCVLGKLNREQQVAIFFASSMRNIGTALALAVEFFPPAAALPAVLAILFQHTNAALMGRIFWGKTKDGS